MRTQTTTQRFPPLPYKTLKVGYNKEAGKRKIRAVVRTHPQHKEAKY